MPSSSRSVPWGKGSAAEGLARCTGETSSPNFPTTEEAMQTIYRGSGEPGYLPGGDAFVTKLNAGGSSLVFSTFLGGLGDDRGLDRKSVV